jgi:hypothetical protein
MSNFDALKNIVRVVAPGIATALGGPAAGIAVASLSNLLLGKPNGSTDEIEGAIASASPDMLLKLKELDMQLQRAQLETQASEFNSARQQNIEVTKVKGRPDWIMHFIVIAIFGMVGGVIAFNMHIPDGAEKETLDHLFNYLGVIIGFYFGNNFSKK